MNKGIILKLVFLVLLLGAVATVIFVTMRGLTPIAPMAGRERTLFEQFVTSGGWIVWFILLPMSFATVYLTVLYAMTISRKNLVPAGVGDEIGKMALAVGLKGLAESLAGKDDLVSVAVGSAIKRGRDDWFRLREAFFESLQEQAMRLSRKVEWVNLIGNVAPMVGLFGTVVGMIQLFGAIVTAGGQPQPVQLAGGISVALVTTFWGLLIAIPALAVYGIFRNHIEEIVNDAASEGEDALINIRNGLESRRRMEQPKQKQEIVSIETKPSGEFRQSTRAQQL
jgi:biopolymer transport protein ExbB